MSIADRDTKTLRLTQEQNQRLKRAAQAEGLTEQAFMLAAVVRAIEGCETQREFMRDKRRGSSRVRGDSPFGLGLFQHKTPEPAPVPESPQSHVVVNLGKQDNAADDIVSRLADDVLNGSDFGRDDRLRSAMETLRRLSRNDDERESMARKLTEAVAARSKTKSGSSMWELFKEIVR